MKKEQPIRIAHIIGKMVGGGVESFIMNYYRKIDKTKIQFDFIIDEDSTVVPREEIENMGGRIYVVPPYQKVFRYINSVKKILKENNYKIVHSHLNSLSVFPLFGAFLAGIPIRIAHSHSTTNKKEWKKNLIKNILKPFSKMFATDCFACSEYAGKWLFGNKKDVTIIRNAIDIEKFKSDYKVRNEYRKKMNLENKFVVGHIGRFVEQKNHDFLITIFYNLVKVKNDAVLLLIGEGPLEEKIKEKVKALNLENKVIFLGVRNDVNKLIQTMDCFVFPSLYEGLGIVLIETQCAGIKCISSNNVPYDAKVSENITFLDLNEDCRVWVENILKCMKKCNKEYDVESIKLSGYDIDDNVECLQLKYLNMIER